MWHMAIEFEFVRTGVCITESILQFMILTSVGINTPQLSYDDPSLPSTPHLGWLNSGTVLK